MNIVGLGAAVCEVGRVALEYCFVVVVCCAHLLEEKFEAPLTHVLALVLVLAEPCECKLADTGADILYIWTEVRRLRITVYHAPSIDVASHVENVADVMYLRWS